MNIFGGISFQSKFGIINATIVMFSFFVVKTLLLFRILDYSEITNWYEYLSVIFFMPPFFVVMGDIFRRTKTIEEDAYQKLNAIDATNLIATFNDSGKVISVNKNFCDLMGYTEEELIGQEHKLLVPKEFANSYDYVNFWLNLRNGNSNSGEFERITKNGESKFIMGNYVPIRSSNGKYSVILKVAIAELLYFPMIPSKVTLNEYLEIAKDYSTPKSNNFVNGVLDKLVKDFDKENRLNKTGRGLL